MAEEEGSEPTFAVVGGGVAGLAAARLLAGLPPCSDRDPPWRPAARVVLVEEESQVGGKVTTGELCGTPVELGPDQFLRRDPSAERLARQLGLGDRLVGPAVRRAGIYAKGALRTLPTGLVLGIPLDLAALGESGIVSPAGLAQAEERATSGVTFTSAELGLGEAPETEEASAGSLLRRLVGDEVVDYLVDPLLGGINAGRVDSLSLAVVAPAVAAALGGPDPLGTLGSRRPPGGESPFYGMAGGLGSLVRAAVDELEAAGAELWGSTRVDGLNRVEGGFLLETDRGTLACDGVVLAVPAPAGAALLRQVSPEAARALDEIAYAGVHLLTAAFEQGSLFLPEGWSGFLVPAEEGRVMTAATFASTKWPWTRKAGVEVVRISSGRFGDDRAGDLDDEELAAHLLSEFRQITGCATEPLDRLVTRLPGSFPQYRPGHRGLVERARRALPPRLTLAGALLGGIGVPACITSGEEAATGLLSAPPT